MSIELLDKTPIEIPMSCITIGDALNHIQATYNITNFNKYYGIYDVKNNTPVKLPNEAKLANFNGDLTFKRAVFIPGSDNYEEAENAQSETDGAHFFAFVQAKYEFKNNNFPMNAEDVYTALADLYIIELGADQAQYLTSVSSNLPDYLKSKYDNSKTVEEVRAIVSERLSNSILEVQQDFCSTLEQYSLYGATKFPGSLQRLTAKKEEIFDPVTVAIGYTGVRFYQKDTDKLVEKISYEKIIRWAISKTGNAFAIILSQDQIVFFATQFAQEMRECLQSYVDIISQALDNDKELSLASDEDAEKKDWTDLKSEYVITMDKTRIDPSSFQKPAPPKPKEEKKPVAGGSEWQQYTDASGTPYYYNSKTGETSWTNPADAAKGGWQQVPDGAGGVYYYNAATGETSWTNPEEGAAGGSDWTEMSDAASGSVYYYNNKTGETSWEKPAEMGGGGGSGDWSENVDPGSGSTYYYNNVTGETSWTKPY